MSTSISREKGRVKNRSYQDLAKENMEMLEALKLALEVIRDNSTRVAFHKSGYVSELNNAEREVTKAIAKAERD